MAPAALLAIGLLGALSIPQVAAEKAEAVGASAECVLMINVARNAKLDVFMQPVLLDMELENKAVESLKSMAIKNASDGTSQDCNNLSQPTQANPGILLPFLKAGKASGENFDCADLINTLVNSGITQFKDYDNNAFTYEDGGFFRPFLSFPSLFNGKSLTFGCARTKACKVKEEATKSETEVEKDYLYCMFQPPIEVEKAPFTKEYFKALQARQEANVDLKSLKVSDVRMSGSSSATLAVPAAVASMVAFLLL